MFENTIQNLIMHVSCCTSLVLHRMLWGNKTVMYFKQELIGDESAWKSCILCSALHALNTLADVSLMVQCLSEQLHSCAAQQDLHWQLCTVFIQLRIKKTTQFSLSFNTAFPVSPPQCSAVLSLLAFLPSSYVWFFFFCASFSILCSLKIKAAFSLALS